MESYDEILKSKFGSLLASLNKDGATIIGGEINHIRIG